MNRLIVAAFLINSLCRAQSDVNSLTSKPFIEVTGTSETEVTPDEIYIIITLMERMENREKLAIEKQETDLRQNLKELGIDMGNITLNSAYADYQKTRMNKKDVINSKSYTLKVSSADLLSKVYERLDKINVYDAYLARLESSRIIEQTKENRIKAMKAAKDKVDYLLQAVGKQAGALLQVWEAENYVEGGPQPMYRRDKMMNVAQAMGENFASDADQEISIRKIKIRSGYTVKYEIVNK